MPTSNGTLSAPLIASDGIQLIEVTTRSIFIPCLLADRKDAVHSGGPVSGHATVELVSTGRRVERHPAVRADRNVDVHVQRVDGERVPEQVVVGNGDRYRAALRRQRLLQEGRVPHLDGDVAGACDLRLG